MKQTLVLLIALAAASASADPAIDERTGLVIDDGWVLVNGHCGACHSHKLVTAQRGDADFWLGIIRWMQRTQNLWQLPPEQEKTIVDYLARHYNETEWGRRPPLGPTMLPPAATKP